MKKIRYRLREKAFYRIAAIIFAMILVIVFILNAVLPDEKSSDEENRMLQTFPQFSFSEYFSGRYKTKLENYTNDQFEGRNKLIKVKTSADLTEGQLISNGVIYCRDHYLMEEISAPDQDRLSDTEKSLASFKQKYPNVPMYFLLAPNAANILSDKLPATVKVNDQNAYMDEFFSTIRKNGITPLDVRDALKKAKKTYQIYYRTDHHWTTDGAYAAFRAVSDKLAYGFNISYKPYVVKNDFRGTLSSKSGFTNKRSDAIKIYLPDNDKNYWNSVIYYSDSKKKTTEFYQLDNLKKKDAYTVFGGSNHPYYTIDTPTESKDILLLVKDSYANSMIPFLSQHYRRIIVIDPRYYFDSIDDIMTSEKVTQVMFLYNANTFFTDNTLQMALEQ